MSLNATACCGLYCPDCIHYRNRYQEPARILHKELNRIGFHQYATANPEDRHYAGYNTFLSILTRLAQSNCPGPCREIGGCGKTPCPIMRCCEEKEIPGCWECTAFSGCEKFSFLTPRCGDLPAKNLALIRDTGPDKWIPLRHPFYDWSPNER